jgi:hypothetical protein
MARGRRFKNPNLEGPLDSKTVIHENQLEEGQNKVKVGVTDTQTLKTCFYNHDIEEIDKIRLSDRLQE